MSDPHTFECSPPFENLDADVILRSSDGVHFRYHKVILTFASPFFRDLFALPQPLSAESDIPIVEFHDSALVINALLHFCHPALRFRPQSFDEAAALMTPGHKYSIDSALEEGWEHVLRSVGKSQPIRAYCLACRFKQRDKAIESVKLTLDHPRSLLWTIDTAETETVSGGDCRRLIEYHHRCGKAASTIASSGPYTWIVRSQAYWLHKGSGSSSTTTCSVTTMSLAFNDGQNLGPVERVYAASWWKDFMTTTATALEESPSSSVIKQPKRLIEVAEITSRCDICRAGAGTSHKWNKFINQFEIEVQRAVDEVPFEPGF